MVDLLWGFSGAFLNVQNYSFIVIVYLFITSDHSNMVGNVIDLRWFPVPWGEGRLK